MMKHSDFTIGCDFLMGGSNRWRCTDVGTRTVAAIRLDHDGDPSWYNGPPYAVEEASLDEYDIQGCHPAPAERAFDDSGSEGIVTVFVDVAPTRHGAIPSRELRVFLDDVRPAPEGWVLVRWPEEVIELLKTGDVAELSLDHDLGDERRTGYDVLVWIEEAVAMGEFQPPRMRIHSANAVGRQRMVPAVESIQRLMEKRHEDAPRPSERDESEPPTHGEGT